MIVVSLPETVSLLPDATVPAAVVDVARACGIRLRVEIWPWEVWITPSGCPPLPPSCNNPLAVASGLPVICTGLPPTMGWTILPPVRSNI